MHEHMDGAMGMQDGMAGMDHGGSMSHMSMHMTFYTGKDVTLWTEALTSTTWQGYAGLVALVLLCGFGHEALYAFRAACLRVPAQRRPACAPATRAVFALVCMLLAVRACPTRPATLQQSQHVKRCL